MTEIKAIFIACITSLIPWGVAALTTTWYEPTLSIIHALFLTVLQLIIGIIVGIVLIDRSA
jgi:hypothetical protein